MIIWNSINSIIAAIRRKSKICFISKISKNQKNHEYTHLLYKTTKYDIILAF